VQSCDCDRSKWGHLFTPTWGAHIPAISRSIAFDRMTTRRDHAAKVLHRVAARMTPRKSQPRLLQRDDRADTTLVEKAFGTSAQFAQRTRTPALAAPDKPPATVIPFARPRAIAAMPATFRPAAPGPVRALPPPAPPPQTIQTIPPPTIQPPPAPPLRIA